MGDEHHRAAAGLQLPHPGDALVLELLVAHGQHLVDQQHVGVGVDDEGEPEAQAHARRVGRQRPVEGCRGPGR